MIRSASAMDSSTSSGGTRRSQLPSLPDNNSNNISEVVSRIHYFNNISYNVYELISREWYSDTVCHNTFLLLFPSGNRNLRQEICPHVAIKV